MAIVISGVNNNDKITATDGLIDLLSGVSYASTITAPAITATGNITAASINVGNNIQLGNAGVATATTFVGNLTGNVNNTGNLLLQIGGSEKFRVGGSGQLGIGGANYGTSGQVLTSGGSGSAATWSTITGTTINNNADNRLITGSGSANTLEGEANLTFDGNNLQNLQSGAAANLTLKATSNSFNSLILDSNRSASTQFAILDGRWNGTPVTRIQYVTGTDGTNKDDGYMAFHTRESGQSLTERLRITAMGDVYAGNDAGYAIFDNSTIRPRFQFRQGTGTNRGFALIETRGDANSMALYISKSREGNGTGVINSGDQLGTIQFTGADGTNQVTGAQILAWTSGTVAADRIPTNLSFYTHPDSTQGKVERFRITSDGYLQFHNDSNTNKGLQWYNNVGGSAKAASIEWGNGNANWEFKHFRNDDQADNPYANIDFFTGSTTSPTRALRITNDGNHIREKHSRFATRVQYDSGNEAVDEVLDFMTPHVNVGNDFDASNNYYVAPVDGDYCFFFHTNVAGSSGAYYVNFDVNGSEVSSNNGGRIYDQHTGSGWHNLSGCIMLSLQEGDQVRIRNRVAMNFDGGSYGQFMGWLVG